MTTDRNLYLDSATVNGVTVSGRGVAAVGRDGQLQLHRQQPDQRSSTSSLVLNVSEDAYQGDAQMLVSVDGQIQGYYTVTASHAAGKTQAITISNIPESFNAHDIAVSFVNDAYGGSASPDRNLYVNSMQFDGQAVAGGSATLMNNTDPVTSRRSSAGQLDGLNDNTGRRRLRPAACRLRRIARPGIWGAYSPPSRPYLPDTHHTCARLREQQAARLVPRRP